MTEEEQFFEHLLAETKLQYEKCSDQLHNKNWYYSICGAPIKRGKGILLGINWGVDSNCEHTPQKFNEIPNKEKFMKYKFIDRSKMRLKDYLKLDLDNENTDVNYTNLCFFRTPNINHLTNQDFENSLHLFKHFFDFVKPPWIFSLGIKTYEKLKEFDKLSDIDNESYFGEKCRGVTAKLWNINFYCVPHPNARVSNESRNRIWELIGNKFTSDHNNSTNHSIAL